MLWMVGGLQLASHCAVMALFHSTSNCAKPKKHNLKTVNGNGFEVLRESRLYTVEWKHLHIAILLCQNLGNITFIKLKKLSWKSSWPVSKITN